MTFRPVRLALCASLLAGAFLATPAVAAPSYDACVGFIDTLPALLTTQGTWCLRKDLSTALATGQAITVATNNVTVDCNGFKLGGLAAGPGTMASGIVAYDRRNITVRGCTVRGFSTGISLSGSMNQGSRVEDNLVDYSLFMGIEVGGTGEGGNVVRRNQVIGTGGEAGSSSVYGISARADVVDNTVHSVINGQTNGHAYGIQVQGLGFEIRDNRVRDIVPDGSGQSFGIIAWGAGARVQGNHVFNAVLATGKAIRVESPDTFCIGNSTQGFSVAIAGCGHLQDNLPAAP